MAINTCHLIVERVTKDVLTLSEVGESLRIKTDNFIVYLSPKRMKELKITPKHNLILIHGKNAKIVVCQAEKNNGGDSDYHSIFLNKLVRHNLSVLRGDIVTVQSCKNCPSATYIEIGFIQHPMISKMTKEYLRDLVKEHFRINPSGMCRGNKFRIYGYGEEPLIFTINEINAKLYCYSNPNMSILISSKLSQYQPEEKPITDTTYDDVGGYIEQLHKLKRFEFLLQFPSLYRHYVDREILPKVIFSGCSGVGKSLIVHALANETGVHLVHLNGAEFTKEFNLSGSMAYLEEKFTEAKQNCPCILCLDKMEQIAAKENQASSEIAEVFWNFLEDKLPVVLVGITNDMSAVNQDLIDIFWDQAIAYQIDFPKPDLIERRDILLVHSRNMPFAKNFDVTKVANDTINFTGADIARLCKKVFESNNLSTPLPANKPCTNLDFESAMNSF